MMNLKASGIFCFIALCLISSSAEAEKLFTSEITVNDTDTARRGTNKILNASELYDNSSLKSIFPSYTDNSPVSAVLNLRGVKSFLSYDANSTTLNFRVPTSGIDVSFTGATRDQSQEQFEDWLKGDFESPTAPGFALTRLLRAFVAESPVEPVAGNPNSLETRMLVADFDLSTSGPFIRSHQPLPGLRNLVKIGTNLGLFEGGPFDGQVIDVPIGYQLNFDSKPNMSIIFDLPITFTRTETSWSYFGSFGVGFQYRPTKWWALTPAARIGGVGSIDVGALAVIYSGTLTSYMHYSTDTFRMGLGVMGGVTKTIDGIKIRGYELSYDLTNYVLRYGVDLSQQLGINLKGKPIGLKVNFNETRFWGTNLFLDIYHEMGVAFTLINKIHNSPYEALNFGFEYALGNDYDAYYLKLTYRF